MKPFFLTISILLMSLLMQAQAKTKSPIGEYYLQGVMETASGFKFNQDSTFQFFFSYGALDREGQGVWKMNGDRILLNTPTKPEHDYVLVKSEKRDIPGITVKISGSSINFLQHVFAILKTGDKAEDVQANSNGIMQFTATTADSIELLFEFCPEKSSVFNLKGSSHNFFEFHFEPSIMDVVFNEFSLHLGNDEMTGPHPLDPQKEFTYKKSSKE
ncbi:MAG: hypothetical protein H7Y31_13215 [Chitinophagaceae bacterium]|nr:hypothetical protein [Chitinophagaceae bacterium]